MNVTRLFATSVFVFLSAVVSADVPCGCIAPPGGNCSCEDGQIAICKIRNNACVATCRNPSQGDNRMVVASLVSSLFDTTPDTIGYDSRDRVFLRPQGGRPTPVPALLRELERTLRTPPSRGQGYIIKFAPQERSQWAALTSVDPGVEIRLGLPPALVGRVQGGLQELLPLVSVGQDAAPRAPSAIRR
jgi:hypothetical protein